MSASDEAPTDPFLVVSAHAGDFVWRAGGAVALAAAAAPT
jgi:4-oxalomesaconate hydratase